MIRARLLLFASALSVSLLLAGCGGSGGLASSVADDTPGAPEMSGDTATDAWKWINFRRTQAGLQALARNSTIDKAAKAHSDYQKTNNLVSHDEDPSLPGFTGVTAYDRMKAAGYAFPAPSVGNYASGEVISFTGNELGENAAEALFGAIYHRFVMLEPKYKDIGVGAASTRVQDTWLTADMGTLDLTSGGLGDGNMIVYPFNGQPGVPVSIDSNEEDPDPVPGAGIVGYPVSVHADLTQTLDVQEFTLTLHGSAAPLNVRLLTSGTDSHTPPYVAAIIPVTPLARGAQYDAHFVGKVGQAAVDRSWSFTTAN